MQSWQEMQGNGLAVEDQHHQLIFGEAVAGQSESFPVNLNDEILGWVKGGPQARLIAQLMSLQLQKEAEKKKLGAEVLSLYQELNVIYNFSEKLSQTIEPEVIAKLTLEQAIHSIPSHSGVVVLWNEETKQLHIPARSGLPLFNEEKLRSQPGLLLKIGLGGQSEIVNEFDVLKDSGILEAPVQSLIYAAMKAKHRIMGAIILAGMEAEQYSAAHLKLLVTLALQSSTAIESAMLYEKNIREVREREEAILRIHEVTKKFVPSEFIRALGKDSLTDVMLGDQVGKNVTVLFTDIRDFTTLSEKMTPEENFRFVSAFNARLGPVIRAHRGFINQYLGDSIMALFPDAPEDALKASIEMQEAIQDFNLERSREGLQAIKAGIGLHTGPLIMGITGDEYRLDAATISDTVNTAARIESLTKYYRSPLLLSGDALLQIQQAERYHIRHLGKVQLKGKYNVLNIVECINGYPAEELQLKLRTLDYFNEAMSAYLNRDFGLAAEGFQQVLRLDPEDHAAKYFINIANKYQHQGVPDNWSGAEAMMHK